MIKVLIELLVFLRTVAPFLTSLAIFTLLCILLSRSIKKHATVYYLIFALPFLMVAIPTILRWCGIETTFNLVRVPILGEILRDYIHMAAFGHPLLVIIMYMGALDASNPYVKKLMSIRKELSVISGFPVLTHSLIRVANNFPGSLKYFTDYADFMAGSRFSNELSAGINSFSMVLGIFMLALFLPLWITSFDSVRKRLGSVKWKKLQKWAYVLYATLFIHAMGIHVSGMINGNAGGGHGGGHDAQRAGVVAGTPQNGQNAHSERTAHVSAIPEGRQGGPTERTAEVSANRQGGQGERAGVSAGRQQGGGGRMPVKGFTDFEVSAQAKRIISVISLLLVYGSYLWLRVRKAKRKASQ